MAGIGIGPGPTPDHVPCRNCNEPISWDEICWVHDANGFADCGLTMSGGTTIGLVTYSPELHVDPKYKGARAEPIGSWR